MQLDLGLSFTPWVILTVPYFHGLGRMLEVKLAPEALLLPANYRFPISTSTSMAILSLSCVFYDKLFKRKHAQNFIIMHFMGQLHWSSHDTYIHWNLKKRQILPEREISYSHGARKPYITTFWYLSRTITQALIQSELGEDEYFDGINWFTAWVFQIKYLWPFTNMD